MRGYPQFSFWISMALFNGMIYVVIFWEKNTSGIGKHRP